MAELARSLVSQLRRFVGDRRQAKRQNARLAFSLSLAGPASSINGSRRTNSLLGHTMDVSATGLALVVPTILLGEHHIIGESGRLKVELELPQGPVTMQVVPLRYESLEEHKTETGYLIGAKIVEISKPDRERFTNYVSGLLS
jgi:hypothetical protein